MGLGHKQRETEIKIKIRIKIRKDLDDLESDAA
jgi:hypothetical protein